MGAVALLMVLVVIPTSLPPSGVPAASATTCRMWVVHGRAGTEVVSEVLREGGVKMFVTFCKLQTHGLNDFKGLPNDRPKFYTARVYERANSRNPTH
jgi:hypothetical protein